MLTPYSWTVPGGVNRQVAALAERFTAHGHRVTVIAPATTALAVKAARERVRAVLLGERDGVFAPDEPYPRYFFAGGTYAVRHNRSVSYLSPPVDLLSQHRRRARDRAVRRAAPPRAVRAQPGLDGPAPRRVPAGGHLPRRLRALLLVLAGQAHPQALLPGLRRRHRRRRRRRATRRRATSRPVTGSSPAASTWRASARRRAPRPGPAARALRGRRVAPQGPGRAAARPALLERRPAALRARRLRQRRSTATSSRASCPSVRRPGALPRPHRPRRSCPSSTGTPTSSARRRWATSRSAWCCSRPWPPAPPWSPPTSPATRGRARRRRGLLVPPRNARALAAGLVRLLRDAALREACAARGFAPRAALQLGARRRRGHAALPDVSAGAGVAVGAAAATSSPSSSPTSTCTRTTARTAPCRSPTSWSAPARWAST